MFLHCCLGETTEDIEDICDVSFQHFFLQQNPNTCLHKARHKIKLSECLANTDTYPQKERSSLDSPAVSQGQHTPEMSQHALETLFQVKWVMSPIQKSYHSPKEILY